MLGYALADILTECGEVLCFDADLLILGDLNPLWRTDLSGFLQAALIAR